MKPLLRFSYLALIILGVTIQFTRGQHGDAAGDPKAALADGLRRLGVQADPTTETDILTASSPDCAQPIHATLLRIDGADDDRSHRFIASDEVSRYIYLGLVGQRPDQAVTTRWIFASVLFAVGWRSARPPEALVLIALPRACPWLATRDWATLSSWN
jgi:hypothetical protein